MGRGGERNAGGKKKKIVGVNNKRSNSLGTTATAVGMRYWSGALLFIRANRFRFANDDGDDGGERDDDDMILTINLGL